MQNPLNVGHMYVILMNIGLSPQHGLCQLFRPHPTSLNSYSSNKYNNSTAAIRIHRVGETIKQRTTTSISDGSTLSTQLRHLMSQNKSITSDRRH